MVMCLYRPLKRQKYMKNTNILISFGLSSRAGNIVLTGVIAV